MDVRVIESARLGPSLWSRVGHTRVDSLVNVEGRFLREAFVTDVALERPLAGVRAHVNLQVRLACERRWALHALIRPPLHWPSTHHYTSGR